MNFKYLGAVLGTTIGLTLSSFASAQPVATVGNKIISLEEFNKRYDEVKRNAYNPPAAEVFLEDLVRYEVGVQEAEKQGVASDPIVKERFRQEMYKALVEKALGEKVNNIKVTEAEMKRYYEKSPYLRTSHILVEFKPTATPAEKEVAKKVALEILADVKAGKREFGEIARLRSDDVVTKERGGDLDYQNRITLVPTYYDAALKLKIGEVTGPVETRFGYHIVKLTGRQAYSDITDKRPVRTAVFDEKRKVLFDEYFKTLKGKYKIEVNKAALKGVKSQ